MQHSDITAQRQGKTLIVSKAVRLTADDILAMELKKDGETVTLDLTVALDVDVLRQLIDKDFAEPSMGTRLTETAFHKRRGQNWRRIWEKMAAAAIRALAERRIMEPSPFVEFEDQITADRPHPRERA